MTTDYRAELQRLVKAYDEHGGRWPDHHEQALFQAVEAARATLAQPEPEGVETQPAPSGYAYRYPSIEGGVIRFNHGREVNGSRPLCAIPYWLGQPPTPHPSPVPVAEGVTEKQVMDLADDCAFDRQEISGFDGGRTFHGHGWECTDEQLVTFATELLTRYAHPAIEPVSEVLTDEAIEELTWRHTCEIGDLGVGIAVEDAPAFIRAALARWSRPTTEPVPVAERPWEREGWCDAEGRCWWGRVEGNPGNPEWFLAGLSEIEGFYEIGDWIVLLPHHALPVPGAEVGQP